MIFRKNMPMRRLIPCVLVAGALLLAGGAPARAQLVVEPGSVAVTLAQGEVVERTVTVTNTGSEAVSFCLSFDRPLQREGGAARLVSVTPGEPCGEVGEVLYRIDRTNGPPGWFPYSLTMMPGGRLFVADYIDEQTYELTPDLQYVRSFSHPVEDELDRHPVTVGVTYNADTGTLWWLNVEDSGFETHRALLLEGDLDGNATGRRIELPLAPAPAPYYLGAPAGLAYDPSERLYYYAEWYHDVLYAVDTLGAVVEGYPVAQTAYPTGAIGNGLDAHGGEAGGPEGVRLEVPVALTSDITFFRLVVLDRHGESLGMETVVPDLSDGTIAWSVHGITRSVLDPNGVLYVAFSNYDTRGVVGLRPHPLPPSWLGVSPWSGTLDPGERAEVVLAFSPGLREVGDYTASLQVIEAASGEVVEVPLTLSVTQGTAAEPGPEAEAEDVRPTVYPNPARGHFVVEAEPGEVSLYDVLGRVVRRVELVEGRAEVSTAGLPPGVYVVHLGAGEEGTARTVTVLR